MPDFCTCGVQLPEDARFCHKCGKPQYDYPGLAEESVPPALPVVAAPAEPVLPEISFHNRLAVRVGFFAALTAFLPFMFLLPIPFLPSLVAFLTGFLAVFSYSRLTGRSLSIRSGARMGWITGIFSFTIVAVFLTLSLAAVSAQGGIADKIRDYQGPFHLKTEQLDAVVKLLQDPTSLALAVAEALVILFVILTALPVLGGALGAKVLAKE